MAFEKHIVDRLSTRLPSLLPEHIREDSPIFEMFLEAYFEYLESEIVVLTSKGELTGIQLEDGTSETTAAVLVETGTVSSTPDAITSKLIQEGEVEPFQVGEYIYGSKSGSVAKIKVINGLTLIVDTISGTGFSETETITGRDGNQTGVVGSYKENAIVANNRLLDYSDIDQTLETFLQYFQKDFIPSLDLKDTQNPRLTLKNIGSLYKQKGTADSVKFLMRLLYGEDAEIKFPIDETVFASDSGFNEERRLSITMDLGGTPKQTDKIVQYNDTDSTLIDAEAVVEQSYITNLDNREYSLSISMTHRGEFVRDKIAHLIDRDGVTTYTGTLKGIVSNIDTTQGSIYVRGRFDSDGGGTEIGDLLLETGDGLLLETISSGSMYDLQDVVDFTGGKLDTDGGGARSNVTSLSKGPIEKIYIETSGQTYAPGDIVVFDNDAAGGNGAEAVIGAVGDELILEDALAFEQYEITASNGQTVFGGIVNNAAVRDDHGKPIAINRFHGTLEVHIDGIVQAQTTYTIANDGITFTVNPNLTGGERIEIFTDKSRLLYEDGEEVLLNGYQNTSAGSIISTDQRLRRVQITNPGAGYERVPSVFPGGYLYFDDISGYQVNETVTGGTSNATSVILRLEPENRRLIVKRSSSDTGIYQAGETITGSNSATAKILSQEKVSHGTGAKIYAWSSQIGAIEGLTLTDQGNKFSADAILEEASSFHNMLIQNPSGTLNKGVTITGSISGATAQVQSYDNVRNILKYVNLNGMFAEDEKVTYENSDTFIILKNDPYTSRGKVAGEGLMNGSFLSDKGFASSKVSNIQDSKLYQSHSYIIKVGESINNYRSIVKDLVHPSGHLFFGEVAVKSELLSSDYDGRFEVNPENQMGVVSSTFVPTIIIPSFPTNNLLMEDSVEDGSALPIRIQLEDNSLVEGEDSRDNLATTSKETVWMLHSTKAEVDAQDMILQLKALSSTSYTGKSHGAGHVNILNRKEFITDALNTKLDTEIGASKRPEHTEFTTFIQKSPRRDGAVTVLNIDTADHDYYVNNSDVPLTSEFGNVAVRPADSGKVFQFWHPSEEILILEDGHKILNEEPNNFVRFDPFERSLHGERILMEDDEGVFLLEDETVPEDREYFVTERSVELDSPFIYMEDNHRMVFEDGDVIIKEDSGENVHTFVPLGPTLRTLNKIAFQNSYKIAKPMYLESGNIANNSGGVNTEYDRVDEHQILLEDGISCVLSEESVDEGLSIKQMEEYLGNMYIDDLDTKERRRTNIAFSSYVNSSNHGVYLPDTDSFN